MIDPVTNYRQGDLVQSIARDGLGRVFEVIEVGDTRYPLPLKLQLYRNDKDRAYYYKDFATVRPYDGKPIPKRKKSESNDRWTRAQDKLLLENMGLDVDKLRELIFNKFDVVKSMSAIIDRKHYFRYEIEYLGKYQAARDYDHPSLIWMNKLEDLLVNFTEYDSVETIVDTLWRRFHFAASEEDVMFQKYVMCRRGYQSTTHD